MQTVERIWGVYGYDEVTRKSATKLFARIDIFEVELVARHTRITKKSSKLSKLLRKTGS